MAKSGAPCWRLSRHRAVPADPQRRYDALAGRLRRAAVRLAARAAFGTCRWLRAFHNTECERLRGAIFGRSVRISRAGISSFSALRPGSHRGATPTANSVSASDSWMPLRDGVRRKPMIVVMTVKRILKPTGWVVDMRHYSTRKPVTCHRRFRNASSVWRFSSARLRRGSPITCPRAMSTRMCRAGGVQVVAAVAARSSRSWTARLDTSSASVPCAGTMDGSMDGKTRRGIAITTRARRQRVHCDDHALSVVLTRHNGASHVSSVHTIRLSVRLGTKEVEVP